MRTEQAAVDPVTSPRGEAAGEEHWHAVSVEDVLARLDTRPGGVSSAEVERRLAEYGPNALPQARRRSLLLRFLAQFNNLLIFVLLAASAITALLGEILDTAVILGVVVINAVVGLVQEGRAEKALDAIRSMLVPVATVIRGGERVNIEAKFIVPGDVVLVEPGDRVPADLRLFRARSLRVQEAVLTGESVPVDKMTASVKPDAPLGDRSCMLFSGTLVASGQGIGVVIGTGTETELGRISILLGEVQRLTTPLLRQMDMFARWLTGAILAACAAVFAFGVLAREYAMVDMFMAAIGIAVAAIPEGLPAVLTITLAMGVQRMTTRHAIVRQLPAVETLGAVSVICSDKTGTFTRNEMTVGSAVTADRHFEVTGAGYEPRGSFQYGAEEIDPGDFLPLSTLVRTALLCNDAALRQDENGWTVSGDPMEGALVSLAMKAGLDPALVARQLPRRDEIPFDANIRFMATLHHSHESEAFVCLKGAPEPVIAMCDRQLAAGGEQALDLPLWHKRIEEFASSGQRILALAMRIVPGETRELLFEDVQRGGFVLLGFVGLIDPPREEAIASVRDCRAAGIQVKMITGDHAATARAIAEQLGLANAGRAVTGQDIDAMDDEALEKVVRDMHVFARTSPAHKLRLVGALQANGEVVVMTGDGVNDAPALKRADVGVAMGQKGTEAAKEAAEMVLADDNFASIAAAVREGRIVYDNLRKTIAWTLPTNGGEFLIVVAAILIGLSLPVSPVQILWINMVTAATLGLTLAFEPGEPDVMSRPPRRADEPLLSRFLLWRVAFVSVLFTLGAFGMLFWANRRGLPLEEARTIVVNMIVMLEICYLFSVRRQRLISLTWVGVRGTKAAFIGVATVAVLQLAFTYVPFMQLLFDTRPVSILDGAAIIALGVALLVILEIEKLITRRILS